MRRTLERDKGLVEALCLPVSLSLTPVTIMSGEAIDELMMAQVLRTLIRITTASARCAHQRQSQRMLVWFIRGVLAVRKDRRTIRTALVGEIDPLM